MSDSSKTPELSKEVLDLQKNCDRTAAMARQHAAALAAAFTARHDAATGEAAAALARAIAASVGARSTGLAKADVALTRERADDAQPRRDRDASEVLTRAAIEDVRRRVVGLYDAPVLESLLLAGPMPKDPLQLVKYALRAAAHLEQQKPADFPDALIDGGKPTPKKWAAAIRTPAEKLDAALKAVGTEDAQLVTALAGRDAVFDEAETDEPRARAVLDALLRYARLDAEADRLARPVGSARAPSTEEPSPEPLPDADPTK
jgi:hypothetical protein